MILYEEILREFQKQKVKYVLVGGMAFNLLGGARNTLDMDILAEMTDGNLRKIVKIMKKAGYHVKQPVDPIGIADKKTRQDWIENKHMKAFNFYKSAEKYEEVDIVIDSPIDYDKAAKNAIKVTVSGITLTIISPKDFIKMKTASGRDKDLDDIKMLRLARGAE
jgi:predicted nucleotidyltransferase